MLLPTCVTVTFRFCVFVCQDLDVVVVDSINDVRIVGVVTVTILMCITVAGMEWEYKVEGTCQQHFIFFLITVSNFTFFVLIFFRLRCCS